MNTAAISLLVQAGIQSPRAEIVLRRLLSGLVTPSAAAREALGGLGLEARELDPSLKSIAEIVRSLADAGLDGSAAAVIFGDDGAPAMLALIRGVDRLEGLQSS